MCTSVPEAETMGGGWKEVEGGRGEVEKIP